MKNKNLLIIILAIVIGLLMAIIFSTKSDFVLEDRVEETVADVRELLKLPTDSVHVVIRYVDKDITDSGVTTYAWVYGDPVNHQYVINITNRVTRYNVAEIVAHEMIHIKQYEEGTLKMSPDNPNVACFKGKSYNVLFVPYRFRPWEIEAFAISHLLEYKLKQ